jgi:N-acetylneuraminate lyase
MENSFTGIIPALYTCFNDNGSVNYTETGRLAEWLVDRGANGFYLCGTTGSGLLLGIDERKKIVETISVAINGKVPLMVHVGCMNTRDSQELAKHAGKVKGVCGISSLPPQYYNLPAIEEIEHLSAISSATDLPFYPYVFDSTVDKYGVNNIVDLFSQIKNIAGIKAFVKDLSVHQIFCKKAPSQWQLLHGADPSLCQALIIPGVNGAIGSTYNVVPEIVTAIHSSVTNNNYSEAISLHDHYGGYWMSIQGYNFLTFGRYFLQKRGFKMGNPRPPLHQPSEKEIAVVENKLESVGFNLLVGGV